MGQNQTTEKPSIDKPFFHLHLEKLEQESLKKRKIIFYSPFIFLISKGKFIYFIYY